MSAKASTFKDFTRGGQITMHALRMFGQATRYVIIFTIIMTVAIFIWIFSLKTSEYDRYVLYEYFEAEIKIGIHGNKATHTVKNSNGRSVELYAAHFIKHPKTQLCLTRCYQGFIFSLWIALASGLLSLIGFSYFFNRKGALQRGTIELRGATKTEPKKLAKLLKQSGQASDLHIAGVPLKRGSEIQHILLIGTTGVGKSACMHELMDQVRAKKQRAIVYDLEGTLIPKYYRPEKDFILNPLDERSPAWNIWQEGEDSADFDSLASSLMPLHLTGSDPFWINSARTIFSSGAERLRITNKKNNRTLLQAMFTENLGGIVNLLKGSIAESLVSEKIEKTALSIKATLTTYCKSLMYLRDDKEGPLFSIRRWITRDEKDSWLFISSNALKEDALRPLISVWLDTAAKYVLSLEESETRRLWFFMEEFSNLHQLPSIMRTLSLGRKHGVCFVGAIQDPHQLRTIYGHNETETLLGLFNTKVCYRTNSAASAKWMSSIMGERETVEQKENFSYGANDMRDGVSIHEERRREPVVMDTEFLELENLEGFIRLPGKWPIAKLKFKFQKREHLQPALILRDFSNCQMLDMPLVSICELVINLNASTDDVTLWKKNNQDRSAILIVLDEKTGLQAIAKDSRGIFTHLTIDLQLNEISKKALLSGDVATLPDVDKEILVEWILSQINKLEDTETEGDNSKTQKITKDENKKPIFGMNRGY